MPATARSIDTASISFGLVAIPVKVFSTGEPSHEIHFHMIHAGCGQRVHQTLVCPKHGVIERADIAKGYEVSKGHMIELEPGELKALDAEATGEIAIREFVPATAIDPLMIEKSYYLGPDKGGARPYRLLRDALEAAQLVGVAAFAARGKSYIVMVRPYEDGLAMHQLRYVDEVKPWTAVPLGKLPAPTKAELDLAGTLISQLTHDKFDAKHYTDEVKARVRKKLASKAKTGEVIEAAPPTEAPAKAVDLMAALKASLGQKNGHNGHNGKTNTHGKGDGAHLVNQRRATSRHRGAARDGVKASRA